VPVKVSVIASDACDPALNCKIVNITCSEKTKPGEIVITGDLTVKLAATRNPAKKGKGYTGRIYTITVECKDAAGNTSTATATVLVPKSQGKGHDNDGKDDKGSKGGKDDKGGKAEHHDSKGGKK
jgi:hypothetical protein